MNKKAFASVVTIIFILFIVGISGAVFCWVKSGWIDTYHVEGTVKDKFVDYGDGESYYVVVLEDNTKLEVKRNLWYSGAQFNEDVVYANIVIGDSYDFTCWGWQLDWWIIYWYPNVIEISEIS